MSVDLRYYNSRTKGFYIYTKPHNNEKMKRRREVKRVDEFCQDGYSEFCEYVNIGWVGRWMSAVLDAGADEFTYNVFTNVYVRTGQHATYCASVAGIDFAPLTAESSKMLSASDKAIITTLAKKKDVRVVIPDSRHSLGLKLTGCATYEEAKSKGFYLKATPMRLNKVVGVKSILLGGNLLKVMRDLDTKFAEFEVPTYLDYAPLVESLTGRTLLCSQGEAEELIAMYPAFADICQITEVPDVVSDYEGGELMNMMAGGEVASTGGVREKLMRLNRFAFYFTLGFNSGVMENAELLSSWRKTTSDKDYMFVVDNKLPLTDLKKIDIYATCDVSTLEGDITLYFTSAGFGVKPQAGATEMEMIPYSEFVSYMLSKTSYVLGSLGNKEKYPFSEALSAAKGNYSKAASDGWGDARYDTIYGQWTKWMRWNERRDNPAEYALREARRSFFDGMSIVQDYIGLYFKKYGKPVKKTSSWSAPDQYNNENAVTDKLIERFELFRAKITDVTMKQGCLSKEQSEDFLKCLVMIETLDKNCGWRICSDQKVTKSEILGK